VSKFQAWNFESTENLAKTKKGFVDEEDKFNKEVSENFTAYYTVDSLHKGAAESNLPRGEVMA
jgi:hypothetical protein